MNMLGIFLAVCTLHGPVTKTKVVYKNTCSADKKCYEAACVTKCYTQGKVQSCVQTCKCVCRKGTR